MNDELTGLGPSCQGFAGSGRVGGDDLDAVLGTAQQVNDQHGVHILPHKGFQGLSRGCRVRWDNGGDTSRMSRRSVKQKENRGATSEVIISFGCSIKYQFSSHIPLYC